MGPQVIIDLYKSTITFVPLYLNIHIKFNEAQICICIRSEVRKYTYINNMNLRISKAIKHNQTRGNIFPSIILFKFRNNKEYCIIYSISTVHVYLHIDRRAYLVETDTDTIQCTLGKYIFKCILCIIEIHRI